jgi:hypothetical protein
VATNLLIDGNVLKPQKPRACKGTFFAVENLYLHNQIIERLNLENASLENWQKPVPHNRSNYKTRSKAILLIRGAIYQKVAFSLVPFFWPSKRKEHPRWGVSTTATTPVGRSL